MYQSIFVSMKERSNEDGAKKNDKVVRFGNEGLAIAGLAFRISLIV